MELSKKKLGFGLMRLPLTNPDDPGSLDFEPICEMVDRFIEKGFTYFDTAWMYCAFQSEPLAKRALVERHPRDSFTLATKLNAGFFNDTKGRDEMFAAQLEKTGAGYFDFYLLHGMDGGSYPKFERLDCFNFMKQKKDEGLIRHIGFSYHGTPELLDEVLTKHPEVEFVQLQINYLDWDSPWIQSRRVYEVATAHGIPVVVMEPVKGGTLANVPESVEKLFKDANPDASVASWALRFVASLPNVKVMLSGMGTLAQVEENTDLIGDLKPLTDDEREVIAKATELLRSQIAIPCTGCSYCTDGCPMHIAIPQYFSLYNEDKRETVSKWSATTGRYRELGRSFGKAGDCIQCGQCEGACPQHLPIIENLKKVAEHFGG